MNRRTRIVGLVPILCCLLLGFEGCSKKSEEAAPVVRPVRFQQVLATGGARIRTFSGVSRAGLESSLSFKVAGTVQRLGCQVGDDVKAGRLLAELDPTDYRLQVEEAEASLNRQQAQARNASASYDRIRQLYEDGHASLTELDAARAGSETAQAAVRAAEKGLELARARLRYTRLTAPVDGSIATVRTEVNENVQPGQTVLVLTSGSKPEVQVNVPELLISQIEAGDEVTVTFDAVPGERFRARVTEVGVSATGPATTFPVTALLEETDSQIRPGMAAEVAFSFDTAPGHNRIIVPAVAVGEDRNGRFVFVVEDLSGQTGIARRREVRIGELTSEGIEILEGLSDGDLLITAGVSKLIDSLTVTLHGDRGDGR